MGPRWWTGGCWQWCLPVLSLPLVIRQLTVGLMCGQGGETCNHISHSEPDEGFGSSPPWFWQLPLKATKRRCARFKPTNWNLVLSMESSVLRGSTNATQDCWVSMVLPWWRINIWIVKLLTAIDAERSPCFSICRSVTTLLLDSDRIHPINKPTVRKSAAIYWWGMNRFIPLPLYQRCGVPLSIAFFLLLCLPMCWQNTWGNQAVDWREADSEV